MTITEIVDGILDREREGLPPYLSTHDAGGRTSWGISERAHPEAWANGPPSKGVARRIYEAQYVMPFDSLIGRVSERVREALVDDGVLRGVPDAIKRFQVVIGQMAGAHVDVDGIIGPQTRAMAAMLDQRTLLVQYTCERAIRLTRLVQRRPADLVNLTGWIVRILSFLPEMQQGDR